MSDRRRRVSPRGSICASFLVVHLNGRAVQTQQGEHPFYLIAPCTHRAFRRPLLPPPCEEPVFQFGFRWFSSCTLPLSPVQMLTLRRETVCANVGATVLIEYMQILEGRESLSKVHRSALNVLVSLCQIAHQRDRIIQECGCGQPLWIAHVTVAKQIFVQMMRMRSFRLPTAGVQSARGRFAANVVNALPTP